MRIDSSLGHKQHVHYVQHIPFPVGLSPTSSDDPLAQDLQSLREESRWSQERVNHLVCREHQSQSNQTENRQDFSIHRLSAVKASFGAYVRVTVASRQRWLRTAATTHFLLLDMPPHQLPARSQILRRVSTLVEVITQNREHKYPGVLWLPQENDNSHLFWRSKMQTAHPENGDHQLDNRRLQ